jgi:hypothetical protein
MRSDLFLAKGSAASVNRTTPARPLESAMIQSALILATSSTLVVTLVKSSGSWLGPGSATACQPITGMPASLARSTCSAVDAGSKLPMTMPSGSRPMASSNADRTPSGVPWPSKVWTRQPMTCPASWTPLATPAMPGLVMVWAT